jgi:hypothetical protein
LEPGISLKWFKHAFAPANIFIDLADQRYFPNGFYVPGEQLAFNLVCVNDLNKIITGTVTAKLLDAKGNLISQMKSKLELPAYQRTNIPTFFTLPTTKGGYLILSEFVKDSSTEILKSRRYINVGEVGKTVFWEVEP